MGANVKTITTTTFYKEPPFIESRRSDSLYIGSHRVSMLLSVVLIILGTVLIAGSRKRGRYSEEV